ncbi:hypothetical protein BW686_22730 [Pseudomonas syringae]|uniref:PhcA n=1 Tax=Pseudomonas syringae TaxID=317 RepID=A0A244EKX6_PSESX|nr:HET-C-related protein [Pseudomonas syringae]OUM05161.1 hypothetical protein BW686_22730 [Pseudomonas syringae]
MNPPNGASQRHAAAIDQAVNTNGERLPKPERFEAGDGDKHKHTHGSIEKVLESAGFRHDEIRAIYYGNWLRDYSQLLDPKIVRATTMPKNFPDLLSRDALTRIVDVLAVKEFTDLMLIDRPLFVVTPERLGVYRPSEHIDNPKTVNPDPADPKERDADFEDWVLPDDPALQVDYDTSMKRYIQRSADVMAAGLEIAAKAGPESTDGLRNMGAALHILEDFFAHSNFVELSLIKLGYTDVLPWTSKADCKHQLPLVTGMFSSSDIIASLAEPLGKILFATDEQPFEPIKAGERYERDEIMQIVLSEHPDPQMLAAYEAFLAARDQWAELPFSEQVEEFSDFIGTPGRLIGNAFGFTMQSMTTWFGNTIDDLQTLFGDDPNSSGSTDPTHSQLAKDHAEHPLHALAALLARKAVLQVGQSMLGQWHGKDQADHPATVAAGFFTHPMDSDWQDESVQEWAKANFNRVRQAGNRSALEKAQTYILDTVREDVNRFSQDSTGLLSVFLGGGPTVLGLLGSILGR